SSATKVLWVTGAGDSRVFTRDANGVTFIGPPEDFGSLVQNPDGSFTYTDNYQDVSQFNAAGQLTQVLDPHLVGLTYEYDSAGRLFQVTAPDHSVTTLDYSTEGQVTINEPGTAAAQRWVTVHVAGGNLTGLEHDESINGAPTQVDAR